MTEIKFHIQVDPATQKATSTITPQNARFRQGDQVRFESDFAGTVIVCPDVSPFENLAPGKEVQIPVNGPTEPFTMLNISSHPDSFHFVCGKYNDGISVAGSRVFIPWHGGADTPKPPIGS